MKFQVNRNRLPVGNFFADVWDKCDSVRGRLQFSVALDHIRLALKHTSYPLYDDRYTGETASRFMYLLTCDKHRRLYLQTDKEGRECMYRKAEK